jgi:uncharacterized protein (TIGR02001 family)
MPQKRSTAIAPLVAAGALCVAAPGIAQTAGAEAAAPLLPDLPVLAEPPEIPRDPEGPEYSPEERALIIAPSIAPVDDAVANRLIAPFGLSLSANVTLATQYRYRGANLSGDQVALQGGVDIDHASGFYIGVWGSQLDNRTTGYGGVELDIYGGYSTRLMEGLTADFGVIAYTFPDAPVDGLNFVELYSSLAFSLGPATAKAGVAWDPGANGFAFAGLVRDNLYVYTDVSVGIPLTPMTLIGHFGYTDGTRRFATNSGTFDWSIGARYRIFGPLSASLEYVDAEADATFGPINPNRGGLVGKLRASF